MGHGLGWRKLRTKHSGVYAGKMVGRMCSNYLFSRNSLDVYLNLSIGAFPIELTCAHSPLGMAIHIS